MMTGYNDLGNLGGGGGVSGSYMDNPGGGGMGSRMMLDPMSAGAGVGGGPPFSYDLMRQGSAESSYSHPSSEMSLTEAQVHVCHIIMLEKCVL